jgi:hypothetical protein
VVLDVDGGGVLLEDLGVGGLRLVSQHQVIPCLQVLAVFGHMLFGDEMTPLANLGSCGAGEDPLQVCGPGPVQGFPGEPGVVADEVDRCRGEVVFQVILGRPR